jgi:hypothetical protein
MITTVNFYHQVQRLAIKINDVPAERFLPIEYIVHHVARTKFFPQEYLTMCRVVS